MTITVRPDYRHDTMSGEQRLWCAVIVRALTDALWRDEDPDGPPHQFVFFYGDTVRRRQATRMRDEAIFWLTMPNSSFSDRCYLAGLEPDVVRVRTRNLLDGAKSNADAKTLSEGLSLRRL